MSFNRSGYIGRAPGDSSVVLAKQYFQPTGAGKTFTFDSGYDPGLLDVYRNGVKLINVLDYAATDGKNIILETPVGVGSTVQVVAYKGFNLTQIKSSNDDFTVGSNLYVNTGFGSFNGRGVIANTIDVTGIITAVDARVSGGATFVGSLNVGTGVTIVGSTGVVTATQLHADTLIKVNSSTDSTSSTTGALVVAGGLGVGGDVYIGAGLSVAGTLAYEDVTQVDSVGIITARDSINVSGGELRVGNNIKLGSAGVITATTFKGGLDLDGALTVDGGAFTQNSTAGASFNGGSLAITSDEVTVGSGITITPSVGVVTFSGTADVHLTDGVELKLGDASDFKIYHDGSESIIWDNGTGGIVLQTASSPIELRSLTDGNEVMLKATPDTSVDIYYNGTKTFETTNEGIQVTGFTSTTAGMGVTGGLYEGSFIKAGKLTDNLQIGIATANIFYFTTAETTTGTPNIRWDDTYSLSSKMAVGDVVSLTVITTAAAAGYCANWTIDGNAVTEEWVGGSAPSAGGADGLDIYGFTIIKTGTGTGDSGFKVIGNVTNAT